MTLTLASVAARALVRGQVRRVAAHAAVSAARAPMLAIRCPETAAPSATPVPYNVPSHVNASALCSGAATSSMTAIWHVVMGAKHSPLSTASATITGRLGVRISGASPTPASRQKPGIADRLVGLADGVR